MNKPDVTLYKPGTVVQNRVNPSIMGTVHKSEDATGFEIRVFDEEVGGVQTSPTSQRRSVIAKFWVVIDLPEGYEKQPQGGICRLT
ncbi:hypothetical protein D3C74_50140 [compost metagenome]